MRRDALATGPSIWGHVFHPRLKQIGLHILPSLRRFLQIRPYTRRRGSKAMNGLERTLQPMVVQQQSGPERKPALETAMMLKYKNPICEMIVFMQMKTL